MQNGSLGNKIKMFLLCVLVGGLVGFLFGYLSPVSYQVRIPVEMHLFVGDETNLEQQYYGFKTGELYGDSLVVALHQEGIAAKRLSALALEVSGTAETKEAALLRASEIQARMVQKQSALVQGKSSLSFVFLDPIITKVRLSLVLCTLVGSAFLVSVFVLIGYIKLYFFYAHRD